MFTGKREQDSLYTGTERFNLVCLSAEWPGQYHDSLRQSAGTPGACSIVDFLGGRYVL